MYAKYDFRKKPSSKEDEDEQPLYPRIVSNGTIDFQRIVKEIAQASSFTPADIEGVQLAIENKISEYLISGYHVQLGDLGYFSAKLKARPVMDAKEIHAQSIYFDIFFPKEGSRICRKSEVGICTFCRNSGGRTSSQVGEISG